MTAIKHIFTALLTLLLVVSFQPVTVVGQTTTDTAATTSEMVVQEAGMTPTLIAIPELELFASVESVGQTATGAMDVPSDGENIAWYEPGFAPGEPGHAALAGHLDWEGETGPFWGLADIPTGSLIALVGEDGRILVYSTVSNTSYAADANAAARVFGPADRPRLSLITCEGDFVQAEDTYDRRRVVEAELIFDTANQDTWLSTL